MPNMKLAILLATYNGSRFLREQLDSIINQTYQSYTLYIHDDGSTDDTVKIIREYASHNAHILFLEDPCRNRGAKGSFEWLMSQVEADLYMFCDQDDVWMPKKIEWTIELIEKHALSLDKPFVIFSDLAIVDENLTVIQPAMMKFQHLDKIVEKDKAHLWCSNYVTGCTMLFNRRTRNLSLPFPQPVTMHDAWVALIALSKGGELLFVNRPTILYRQHASNTIGVSVGSQWHSMLNFKKVQKQNMAYLRMIRQLRTMSMINFTAHKMLFLILKIKYTLLA